MTAPDRPRAEPLRSELRKLVADLVAATPAPADWRAYERAKARITRDARDWRERDAALAAYTKAVGL